jgi:hypothetical protein
LILIARGVASFSTCDSIHFLLFPFSSLSQMLPFPCVQLTTYHPDISEFVNRALPLEMSIVHDFLCSMLPFLHSRIIVSLFRPRDLAQGEVNPA